MKRSMALVLIIMALFFLTEAAEGSNVIEGRIVAVNSEQRSILLDNEDGLKEYNVGLNPSIYLNGSEVSLEALRPIKADFYQEVIIEVGADNQVNIIKSYYKLVEIEVAQVNSEEVMVTNLNGGWSRPYELNDNVELLRNNNIIYPEGIKKGDRGVAILGIDGRLISLVLHNYDIRGFLEEIDHKNKEIVLNIGSRKSPKLKKVKLDKNTSISDSQKGEVELADVLEGGWVRIEVAQGRKRIVVRSI
ncbi:hypothetical protein [Halonatronum saccharophilum]|uniref:hypothetical protein n=1 Tax=Halonatronum saccharophilum TaxID=150060 RepID=UPI00048631F8|nr:hypothetical protein [Halonatronum saccharophilum]